MDPDHQPWLPPPRIVQVSGFPTLKFVTADGRIVDYSGDRSEEDIIKFVESNADSAAEGAAAGKDEL